MTTTTTIRTNRFSGNCSECIYPVVMEIPNVGGDSVRIVCPSCTANVTAERLYGSVTDHNCDSRCQYAIGNQCECSCGGANHRRGWIPPTTGVLPASLVDRYRKAAARRVEQGQARREANARRKAEARAAGIRARVEFALGRFGNPAFLQADAEAPAHATDWEKNAFADILTKFHAIGYLTEPQFTLMKRIAEKPVPAARPEPTIPAPSGRQPVVGDVVFTKWTDGDYGPVQRCLVVLDGGAKVWGTLPKGCEKGQRIAFSADFKQKDEDRFFAFYKRPTQAQVVGVASQSNLEENEEDSLS